MVEPAAEPQVLLAEVVGATLAATGETTALRQPAVQEDLARRRRRQTQRDYPSAWEECSPTALRRAWKQEEEEYSRARARDEAEFRQLASPTER